MEFVAWCDEAPRLLDRGKDGKTRHERARALSDGHAGPQTSSTLCERERRNTATHPFRCIPQLVGVAR